MYDFEVININDLPKYSQWTARLMGISDFRKPKRNLIKVVAEYDRDKYAKLLAYYWRVPFISLGGIRAFEVASLPLSIPVSIREKLYLVTRSQYETLQRDLLDSLKGLLDGVSTVVELGCGYGYNLEVLREKANGARYIGGDCSRKAIELGRLLFSRGKQKSGVTLQHFNFYDRKWDIFDKVEGKALVFTRHAIEQIPKSERVLSTLERYEDKIATVVHLEPVAGLNPENTLLGQLRQSYAMLNDYNTDLLSMIQHMGVSILKCEYDVFGENPLNPTSVIVWRF